MILKNVIYNTTFRITEDNMVEVTNKDLKGGAKKYITFDDLINAITSSVESERDVIKFNTPILPHDNNNKVSTILYHELSNNKYVIFLKREKDNVDFDYGDKIYENVGIPRLVFAIKVFNNSVLQTKVVAIKDKIVTENTAIYCYPFSNVYSDGNVCWGGVQLPAFDNAISLKSMPDIFLSSPSNNHLYGKNLSSLEYRPLLEELSNREFKDEYLSPMGKVTFKSWVDRFSKE